MPEIGLSPYILILTFLYVILGCLVDGFSIFWWSPGPAFLFFALMAAATALRVSGDRQDAAQHDAKKDYR